VRATFMAIFCAQVVKRLSPKGVQVARYLDQRLLGKVLGVGVYATPIVSQAYP